MPVPSVPAKKGSHVHGSTPGYHGDTKGLQTRKTGSGERSKDSAKFELVRAPRDEELKRGARFKASLPFHVFASLFVPMGCVHHFEQSRVVACLKEKKKGFYCRSAEVVATSSAPVSSWV